MPDENDNRRVAEQLQRVLDLHGYGFHYAVLRRADELLRVHTSPWQLQAVEFPVQVQGFDTRLDLLLKHKAEPVYLVGECKRANPALANWCFAKAPYTQWRSRTEAVLVDKVFRSSVQAFTSVETLAHPPEVYRIALEVRTDLKGDASGSGRGGIEDALTQAVRGSNGLIQYLGRDARLLQKTERAFVLPAVFTTARLWTSDVQLDQADLATGRVMLNPDGLREVEWLVYQYHPSPGIKHTLGIDAKMRDLSDALLAEFTRSVMIVSAGGIDSFFSWCDHTFG